MSEGVSLKKRTRVITINNISVKSLEKLDYIYAARIIKGNKATKVSLIERAIDLLAKEEEKKCL